MPSTLYTLCHLIPMRTKEGSSYLILQKRTIQFRKISNFLKSNKLVSGTAKDWNPDQPSFMFFSLKNVIDSQPSFLPKHT